MTLRLFTAIQLPDHIRDRVARFQPPMSSLTGIKWVEPNHLHLTLRFLGDYDDRQVDILRPALRQTLSGLQPFDLALSGFDVFPNAQEPRVLYVPAITGEESLVLWVVAITRGLEQAGLPFDPQPFRAHLTLGRVKKEISKEQIEDIRREVPPYLGGFLVEKFELIQSRLTSRGPFYEIVECFQLG